MDFTIRPMDEFDLSTTLEWRNDPTVLASAKTSNPISMNEHEAMYKYNNAIKLVFEFNNVPVGYVQFSRDPDHAAGEWSFHMAPEWRGKGLSEIMLKAALYYVNKKEGFEYVTSFVKKDNFISNKLHIKLGFELIETSGEFDEYVLYL